ncbi:putative zinc protease PqqL [Nymphon striatum]|nr:putative zinc protease PqqL [Nymphon striatum]
MVLLPPYLKDRRASSRTFRSMQSNQVATGAGGAQRFLPLQHASSGYSTSAVNKPTGMRTTGVSTLGSTMGAGMLPGSNVVQLRPVDTPGATSMAAAASYLDEAPIADESTLHQAWDTPSATGVGMPRSTSAARERRRQVLLALTGTAFVTLLFALFAGGNWIAAHVFVDVAMLGYVILLVRHRQLAADRMMKVEPIRPPVSEQPAARIEPEPTTAQGPSPVPTASASDGPEATPDAVAEPTAAAEQTQPVEADVVRPADSFDAPSSWQQPVALDAAVLEGTLTNGMRYLIRQNDRPGSQVQLRLVVQAGSINEADGAEGAAHFLEHMMFNGTELYPGNEIVQLGLDVLHQWATAATLEPEDIIAERGVVREEHRRSTQGLAGRLGQQARDVLLADTDYLGNEPIGLVEVIDNMNRDDLLAFYQRWYRPELMTVIAVGDINPAEIERRIEATFDGPTTQEQVRPLQIDRGPGSLAEPIYDVVVDAEVQRSDVEVLWRLEGSPLLTLADARTAFVRSIAMSMLNERLFERVQSPGTVLQSGNAGLGSFIPSVDIASLGALAEPSDIGSALTELLSEFEQARQHGFSQAEFDRAAQSIRASAEQAFAVSDTRQDGDYAADLVEYSLGRFVPTPAEDQRAAALQVLDSISAQDAQGFLFDVLESQPYVRVVGPAADESALPEPEQLADIFDAVIGAAIAPRSVSENEITELMARPAPAAIVDERTIVALDARVVTFENGVRMAYRQSNITENLVEMYATSPGGFFAAEGPVVPLLGRAPQMVAGSGFESVDIITLNQLLTGKIASLRSSIGRSSESLDGESSTGDIETLLQLVHLQMTQATISDVEVRQFDEGWRALAENPDAQPGIAGDLELWTLRYGDSPYFRLIPTIADLDGLDPDLVLEAYNDRFDDAGDFVFVFVGDFDPVVLRDLGARYLGTLPDTGVREEFVERDPGLPEENLVSTVAAGIGDQGRVRINWESPYPFTLQADVAAEALDIVVNARLRDLIREQLGASYSPNSEITVLAEPIPWVDTNYRGRVGSGSRRGSFGRDSRRARSDSKRRHRSPVLVVGDQSTCRGLSLLQQRRLDQSDCVQAHVPRPAG